MKKYNDFKEYMEDVYYDEIFNKIKGLVYAHKDSFESDTVYSVSYAEPYDIHVSGVTFKEQDNGLLEIRVSVDADISVKGKTQYGYDEIADNASYNVFFRAKLEDGLHQVTITNAEEYNPAKFEKDKSLSQDLVPYLYEDAVEKNAEDFLKRHYPKALLQPMPLPVFEVAKSMGMTVYYAPLEDSVFGRTYFGSEKVTVYTDNTLKSKAEIVTKPGTMLINPNVYFMRNVGTANNTIIHECVHWDRHRKAFELQRLLTGNCNHISCEIVDTYEGIPDDAPALKWMEWQANQLAPRILMPAKMTEKIYSSALRDIHTSKPLTRFAEVMEEAVGYTAQYFGVSFIAAKLRLMDLGYDVVQGTYVYNDGKYMPPFYFAKGTLEKNQTYIVDEKSAMLQIFISDELRTLYFEGKIIYANCMVCINSPKYVTRSETGLPILTEYALEHVHECCFVFNRKVNVSDTYSDSFYRRCFLCRDVNSETYIEAKYDPNHKDNQSKLERKAEIDKITESVTDIVRRLATEVPGGFSGTLSYHMNRKNITNEELSYRTNISTVSISNYRNTLAPKITLENAIALCNGLKLVKQYSHDLLKKAGYDLETPNITYFMVGWVIDEHPDDTLQQWQDKFNDANIKIKLPGCDAV